MRTFFALLLACSFSASAHARQDPAPVSRAIEQYLGAQMRALPGEANFEIRTLDAGNALRPCANQAIEVGMAPGAKLLGRTNVAVRCTEPGGWSIFVPVRIRVVAEYLVAARPIATGQAIMEADLARQRGDLSDLPPGILTDPAQALDRTAGQPIPAGRPLRTDMLRLALVVKQGQSVKVVSRGPGFQVANEGKALNNAFEGQVTQVRLSSGQIVSGIARHDGQVEVSH